MRPSLSQGCLGGADCLGHRDSRGGDCSTAPRHGGSPTSRQRLFDVTEATYTPRMFRHPAVGGSRTAQSRQRGSYHARSCTVGCLSTGVRLSAAGGAWRRWHSNMSSIWCQWTSGPSGPSRPSGRRGRRTDHCVHRVRDQGLESSLNCAAELRGGQFRPQPVPERKIPKPGRLKQVRRLGIPTVADRVIQAALRLVLEPSRPTEPVSYGTRPARRPF